MIYHRVSIVGDLAVSKKRDILAFRRGFSCAPTYGCRAPNRYVKSTLPDSKRRTSLSSAGVRAVTPDNGERPAPGDRRYHLTELVQCVGHRHRGDECRAAKDEKPPRDITL